MVQVSGREVSPGLAYGICTRPCWGEFENGDRGLVVLRDEVVLAMVVDGLGHGPKAARAASMAVDLLAATSERDPTVIMGALNEALRGTVGAAASIISLDCLTGGISYCGVGNVAARVTGGVETRLVGIDGVLGALRRTLRLEQACLAAGGMAIMTSDGISLGFNTGSLLGLTAEDAARLLVDKHGRPHDDATSLVLRIAP